MTDTAMLSSLCGEIRNYFVRSPKDKISGTFVISGGVLTLPDAPSEGMHLADGQYYRVIGSVFNDGVRQYPASALTDEIFTGEVWLMAPPPEVTALAEEIAAWVEKYGETAHSPYQSESFGGYSYTVRGASRWRGDTSGTAADQSWQAVFRRQLNPYRRMKE